MTEDSLPPDSEPTRTFALPPEGTPFGHYQLGRRLGAGGMGEVYAAVDTTLGRQVALKFLPPTLTANPEMKARLFREARSAAVLSHPNIVTIYEVGEEAGRPYLAMEMVEGKTLNAVIAEGTISIAKGIEWSTQIAEGLCEAHAKGVIHRDIKPSNLLLDRKERIKILDFGLAKTGDAEPLTQTGSTLGTVGYMAPEQIEGGLVDARADIFSLGVVMYQIFAGRSPFSRDTAPATLYAVVHDNPPKLSSIRPDISATLERIIEKAITKSPAQRYQSADELGRDLAKCRTIAPSEDRSETAQSIAVLPFADMSPAKDQEYFCDGLAEELINALTRLQGLKVVSRTSAFQFKGQQADIRRIGDQLGVKTVLEGSVRKAGDRLRITAQLIAVADGMHLWSDKFDRTADDLFAIQDEISTTIVETLKMKLMPSEQAGLKRRSTQNLQAYDLYLQGRFLWNQRTHESIKRGLSCFEKAIALDPEFALAYVGLSDSLFMAYAFDFMSPGDAIPRAREAVTTALELDPQSAEAHTALGGILAYHDWRWAEAEQAFLTAIACNPSYDTAHHWYAEVLALTRRPEEAEREFQIALTLDPLSWIINSVYGVHLYVSRRFDEAERALQRVIELGSRIDMSYGTLGMVQLSMGKTHEAIATLEQCLAVSGRNAYSLCVRILGSSRVGDKDTAQKLLHELHEKLKIEYIPPTLMGYAEWNAGNIETARGWFTRAYDVHDLELAFMGMPAFDDIRQDPHVAAIIRNMGLTP